MDGVELCRRLRQHEGQRYHFVLLVTSKDGKRVEKVDIAKSGSVYLAKRAEGPALFELDAKAVDGIQKAASELKPAEIPPAKK